VRAGYMMQYVLRLLYAAALLWALPGMASAQTDVTSQFQASFSGLVFNRVLGTFVSTLTLTNIGPSVYAPLVVQVNTNSGAVAVQNGTALSSAANTFAVSVSLAQGSVVTGESVQQSLQFANPTRTGFIPSLAVITGASAPPGLTLQVISPTPGSQVAGPTFLVSGTIAGPSLTGASVNNLGACLVGQGFYLNSFRPGSGTTSFAAAAVDVDGGGVSVTVPYLASTKGLTVQAMPNCGGIAPLNALFNVALETMDGDSIQTLAIDFNGDGVIDQTLTAPIAPNSIAYTYTSPGLYQASFSATTAQGVTLTQSVVINVQTVAGAFARVGSTLQLLQNALTSGNLTRAASYFTPTSQVKYLGILSQPGVNLIQAATALSTAVPEAMIGDFAQAVVIGPAQTAYSVVLVRDSAGIWRIDSW
jgi:hypothetical protein